MTRFIRNLFGRRFSLFKKPSRTEQQMLNQYLGYRSLLEKMDCAVVEYHVKENTITANDFFIRKYTGQEHIDKPFTLQRIHEVHPEFNYKEMDEAIRLVLKQKHSCTMESAIISPDGKISWVEITLMPQADLSGEITDILAGVADSTREHERNTRDEVISNTPSGIHRCYLSQPIHLEFASKGMCQMLGYTEEEFDRVLAPDRKLSRLVHPDDLDKFISFVRRTAKTEGRYQQEYRIRKKDGSYVPVLDVTEVKRAASGVMYGYSSVTDITDFQRAEAEANAKLRAAEEELEKHINRERKIIADKEKAEEKFRREALRLLERSRMTQEESNRLVRAISSINSDYSAIYFVDLDSDQYQLCKTTELLRRPVYEMIRNKACFSETILGYIDRFVLEEDRSFMKTQADPASIRERLSREKQYFLRYRLAPNDSGQVYYEMHVVNCSEGSTETKVTVGFRCLDAVIAEEAKHRQEVENLENRLKNAQLKNSMSQMQPHFLYNALASIREIVLDDPKYASDLLYDFSTHLRACIRSMSENDLIPFSQELENIRAYVSIEKMRFGDRLHTRMEISDQNFSIVPLSIQPLVENAIRHGIYERGAMGGTVTVSAYMTDTSHIIRVSDDGVGFDYQEIVRETREKNRDSTGLTNLIFRLKQLMNADVQVESTPGVGSVITVSIPR